MKLIIILALFVFCISESYTQTTVNVNVDASAPANTMSPVWRDHYECHMMDGYGGNPSITGPHTLYTTDAAFSTVMADLKPRFIRISIGRMDNPPDTSYYSMNTNVLRNLKYEFYKGGNSIAAANNMANYDFSYIDSAITKIISIGAEPFITMDYMPYTLSRDTTPVYQPTMNLVYNLAYDNSVRNSPPQNNAVYGRVMYQFIKHCYQTYGVRYYEHWNEPDQQWANPIMVKFFWKGDEYELYDAYAAIADEVSADITLAGNVKLGGCSFAFYSILNLMPTNFLNAIQVNNKKFDFLSFHPYSDVQYKGGYDTAKVNLAIQWRNTYVPNAELINAEWGRIDQNTTVWGDLDYGLNKCSHIIDMLNRGVTMSHDIVMFDNETSNNNFAYPGMFRVGPIVPKPTAYVFYNLNKMNNTLNRLPLTINSGMSALAGKSNTNDKIVVVLPAEEPAGGLNTINLTVTNLPWGSGGYYIYRYELTEQSYLNGVIYDLTYSNFGSGSIATDFLTYPSTNNSGRLVVWEISANPLSGMNLPTFGPENFILYPNPNRGSLFIESKDQSIQIQNVQIINSIGQTMSDIEYSALPHKLNLETDLQVGLYFAIVKTNKGIVTLKFLVEN